MPRTETATLGGGCFWCLEAVYEDMIGVLSVDSGYMGGHVANPSYEQVCAGTTGHAEVVQVTFDPEQTTYREILEVFFTIHDPTTPGRQGDDVGPQYRSVIFLHSNEQRETATQMVREIEESKLWPDPIVTELAPASTFYRAEDYHREYFRNHMTQPYCLFVVAPKFMKFRKRFPAKSRSGT